MFSDDGTPYITDPVSFSQKKDGGAFSIDPEELIKEVEEVARQKAIDRVKERKERHVGRLEARRFKRRNRKARAKRERMFVAQRLAERQELRDHQRARYAIGRTNHVRRFVQMPMADFRALEKRIAAHWCKDDLIAIANGLPLNIDKQLDARLMG